MPQGQPGIGHVEPRGLLHDLAVRRGRGDWNWSWLQGGRWSLETRFVQHRHGPESVLSWWREISEEALAFAPGCAIGQGTQFDLDESDDQQASALAGRQPLLPATVTNPVDT